MNAFDTDVFSEILLGNAVYVSRLSLIPADQQSIPIIVAEEILRGRLNVIRQAEAGKSKITLDLAYQLFEETIRDLRRLQILSYTAAAETTYQRWRESGIRISTHDLHCSDLPGARGDSDLTK